jgi:hypothetical protein
MKRYFPVFVVVSLLIISSGCTQQTRIGDYMTPAEPLMPDIQMEETFAATIPAKLDVSAGSRIKFKMVIKKTREFEDFLIFSLCVSDGYSSLCSSPRDGPYGTVGFESGINIEFNSVMMVHEVGDVEVEDAVITVSEDTISGTYSFTFYACPVESIDDECVPSEAMESFTFILNVGD